jgi:hypothetical protein
MGISNAIVGRYATYKVVQPAERDEIPKEQRIELLESPRHSK